MNSEQEQLHFIGVGGVGMSGIARVAHDQGMAVSGSDIKESRYTKQLRDAGVTVFIGQDGANIPDGDVTVVVSTAILENNPELIEARRRNLPIVHRAQMLARLGRDLDTLAVAGTHGKTTTSSMLASTLDAMGYDPTFLIGGIVRAYGTNAHSGRGRSYVVEADDRIVATAMIGFSGERDYDRIEEGSWLTSCTSERPCYGVVHRVAVASDGKNRGAATFLLARAEELARANGSASVRIDTHPGNAPMRKLLAKAGYEQCGIIYIAHAEGGTPERIAYERLV